ncbi:UNVERIFIED_CONTAM: Cytochrome c oxidase subunit [Sesamum calycinum]|uniref:Cytochrome c oxidase subunit 2 n=2 Tax=Sesamum calycinum TaxID=2727403 RepID=A0AAW2JW69_9LAMI
MDDSCKWERKAPFTFVTREVLGACHQGEEGRAFADLERLKAMRRRKVIHTSTAHQAELVTHLTKGGRYGVRSHFFEPEGGVVFELRGFPLRVDVLVPLRLPNHAEPWQLGSQDAATPMMQGIIDLHHDIFFFLILIFVFVSWILVRALWHFHYKKNPIPQRIVHGTTIEILWTIFPSIILMFIAIPSFALLYSMDEVVVDPAITIKAIGHQWYWTYEYSDYNSGDEQSLTFDSYTIPEDDPELGQSRLLEVDNRVVVPEKTHLRIIVTPADVPHSWAVPSLGVKCDAVPGRLNQTSISVQREGVYYGQCSEICGTNHAFMPIVVEAVSRKDYGSRVSCNCNPKVSFLQHFITVAYCDGGAML